MNTTLFRHRALQIRQSPIHGYGVFADQPIAQGEMIVEVRCLILNRPIQALDEPLVSYAYQWPYDGEDTALGLGEASLFNHSPQANARWITDTDRQLLVFYAQRNIAAQEEILIDYGPDYWRLYEARHPQSSTSAQ